MAKYDSLFTIHGTIDGLTFRETAEGKIVGAKTGPTREQVLSSDRFTLTRYNAAEFKQSVQAATLLRRALDEALEGLRCTSLNGHVNGLLHRLTRSDTVNDFGQRCASAGDIQVLKDFEFNRQLGFSDAAGGAIEHQLDGNRGVSTVFVAPYQAYKKKAFNREATHFRLVSGVVAIDFTNRRYQRQLVFSELLPLSRKTPRTLELCSKVPVQAGQAMVQVLGIQLFEMKACGPALVKGGALRILDAAWAPVGKAAGLQKPMASAEEMGNVSALYQASFDYLELLQQATPAPAGFELACSVARAVPFEKRADKKAGIERQVCEKAAVRGSKSRAGEVKKRLALLDEPV